MSYRSKHSSTSGRTISTPHKVQTLRDCRRNRAPGDLPPPISGECIEKSASSTSPIHPFTITVKYRCFHTPARIPIHSPKINTTHTPPTTRGVFDTVIKSTSSWPTTRKIHDTLLKLAHNCCIYMTLHLFARNWDLGPERSEAELGERSERGESKTSP